MKHHYFRELRRIVLLLAACNIIGLNQSAIGADENSALCGDLLQRKALFFERRTVTHKDGKLVFSKAARAFFAEQRHRLREYDTQLAASAVESEHAIQRDHLAQMLGANILKFGGPGGAKSVLARQTVFTPIEQPDGTARTEAFAILFNQLQSDAIIRGYIDPEQLSSAIITPSDVKTNGTMLQARRALGDEIDKASPKTIGAILDLMDADKRIAQFGPITLQARLEFVVLTSNLTPSELLMRARSSNMDENMGALLNRIAFKVWLPNTVLFAASREKILNLSQKSAEKQARKILEDPESRFKSEQALNENYVSHLPSVDFRYLGAIAAAGLRTDTAFTTFAAELFDNINKTASMSSLAEEQQYLRSYATGLPGAPSSPASLQSNRDLRNYVVSVIQASLLRDLLLLPEEILPTETLIDRLSQGWNMDEFSAWRMHEFLLTGAPGDLALELSAPVAQTPRYPILTQTLELNQYLRYAKTKRDQSHIEHIKSARERFIAGFRELVQAKIALVGHAVSAIEPHLAKARQQSGARGPQIALSSDISPEGVLLAAKKRQGK